MDCSSLDDLSCKFNEKIKLLELLLDLKCADDSSDYMTHIHSLDTEIESLETVMALLKLEVEKQKQKCNRFQEVKASLESLICSLKHSLANIPVHLPRPVQKEQVNQSDSTESSSQSTKVKKVTNPVSRKENLPPKPVQSGKRKHKNVYIPTVQYVTIDEFEAVPKYMKGRLTYIQVNASVDELNKAFKEKYRIMGLKLMSMSDVNRKRYDQYKQQESKDTQGEYFVVESDIKEFSNLKLDKIFRSILTVLRHCGRVKEVRGGGYTRYSCVDVY